MLMRQHLDNIYQGTQATVAKKRHPFKRSALKLEYKHSLLQGYPENSLAFPQALFTPLPFRCRSIAVGASCLTIGCRQIFDGSQSVSNILSSARGVITNSATLQIRAWMYFSPWTVIERNVKCTRRLCLRISRMVVCLRCLQLICVLHLY